MNKQIQSGIITAALTTVLGTSLSLVGSSIESITSITEVKASENQQSSETTFSISQNTSIFPNKPIATVESHRWQGIFKVILRVRDIPVLSFTETGEVKSEKSTETAESVSKAVAKANQVASRLNQLDQNNFDANQITVSWNQETGAYVIKIQDEVLVSFDETVTLPDTTNKPDQDALQATNRLRRLMGDAKPIQAIANQPQVKPQTNQRVASAKGFRRGVASWYGPGFHGRRTANGERFNQHALTAAHRSLPFGTQVKVTNLNNGRSVVVRINDRGPFSKGRIIDLSKGAAKAIGVFNSGVAPVAIEVLK
jgi:rare lipoprotein A